MKDINESSSDILQIFLATTSPVEANTLILGKLARQESAN